MLHWFVRGSFFVCLFVTSANFVLNMFHCRPKGKQIAILALKIDDRHKSMICSFKEHFTKEENLDFYLFNANGSESILEQNVQHIVNGDYDLVFSIGPDATSLVYRVLSVGNFSVPIVFTDVCYPKDIVGSNESKYPISGVVHSLDFNQKLTNALPKDVKNLMVIYNPRRSETQKDIDRLSKLVKQKKMNLSHATVFSTNDISKHVDSEIEDVDCILVLKDGMVLDAIYYLVNICKKYNKYLVATDLDLFDKGVTIGFGIPSNKYGEMAAGLAIDMLKGEKKKHVILSDFEVLSHLEHKDVVPADLESSVQE